PLRGGCAVQIGNPANQSLGPSMALAPSGRLRRADWQSCQSVEPRVLIKSSSLHQKQKRPLAGPFLFLAEREGFEPSIRLLTRYSLSRGAPSAARASLRNFEFSKPSDKSWPSDRRHRIPARRPYGK